MVEEGNERGRNVGMDGAMERREGGSERRKEGAWEEGRWGRRETSREVP